ncbi:MAG: amidohydrolase family protein [Desulfovibrionaceae bacterium]
MKTNTLSIVHAARLLTMVPGQEPIRDAAIVHDGRFIVRVGAWSELGRGFSGPVLDLGQATVCPGVVNAHAHLEMSHLKGKVARGLGFTAWIKSLITHEMYAMDQELTARLCREMRQDGTALIGNISTRNAQPVAGILDDSGLFFVSFHELIRFDPPAPEAEFVPAGEYELGVLAAAGHAFYSTHPETLRRGKAANARRNRPFSLHLAENEEESRILMGEHIEFWDMLERANISLHNFQPPRCTPTEYARQLGLLDSGTLAVHCVTVNDADIEILHRTGTNVCLCPRSNEYIGEGRAPWEKLLASGVNCCLGTDGLCSNDDLNVWNELLHLKAGLRADLDLEQGLALLTRNGATALGRADRLGSMEPGKAARWSVVPDKVLQAFDCVGQP